jgi:hypothetical protein
MSKDSVLEFDFNKIEDFMSEVNFLELLIGAGYSILMVDKPLKPHFEPNALKYPQFWVRLSDQILEELCEQVFVEIDVKGTGREMRFIGLIKAEQTHNAISVCCCEDCKSQGTIFDELFI